MSPPHAITGQNAFVVGRDGCHVACNPNVRNRAAIEVPQNYPCRAIILVQRKREDHVRQQDVKQSDSAGHANLELKYAALSKGYIANLL